MSSDPRDTSARPMRSTADIVAQVQRTVSYLKEEQTKNTFRFDNGRKAFDDLREEITKLKPVAPNMYRIIGITLTVISLVGGAVWVLATSIGERTTHPELKEALIKHDDTGHSDLREDFRAVQREQSRQNETMKVELHRLENLINSKHSSRRRR